MPLNRNLEGVIYEQCVKINPFFCKLQHNGEVITTQLGAGIGFIIFCALFYWFCFKPFMNKTSSIEKVLE